MPSHPSRVEEEAAARYPALDAAASWDKLEFLRGAILGLPQLIEHARALAGAHGVPNARGRSDLVVNRLRHTRLQLQQAYAILSKGEHRVREPTPAEEWLLDNAHIVEDQLREVSVDLPRGYLTMLPRLASGALRGAPRVYALCLDYLRHTDARVEAETLAAYVTSYQSVHPLSIGELWAVPIMLRIGLLMRVATVATEAAQDQSGYDATQLAKELSSARDPQALLARVPAAQISTSFLVELRRAVLEQETDSGAVLEWIAQRAHALGSAAEEMGRIHHLHRAEDQLTVGHAITSMRTISAYDWSKFFERTSLVEAILLQDPHEVYAHSDSVTRDRMRHTVERIARRNSLDEREVARAALRLAQAAAAQADGDAALGHVGYYLLDRGRRPLERELKARPPYRDWIHRVLEAHGSSYYFGGVLIGTVLLAGLTFQWLTLLGVQGYPRALILALLCISVSEVALGLLNSTVMALMPPRVLSKLAFKQGIPKEHATLVVVPTLLDSEDAVARLLGDLEIRALANMEPYLHFALLTDFCDADEERRPQDQHLIAQTLAGIDTLNARHPRARAPRFMLLHRKRVYNPSEQCFMGWERKRGKLEELNRLLLGARDTTFDVVTASPEVLSEVRYVITLDSDTELPRGTARKLVAAMAHPLNRPRFDAREGRVVAGYAIIQPRVGVMPTSSRRSRFARICAGAPGIDPYTSAASDVYQDLFAEGSFVGKGIYDVRAFSQALHGLVPENTLLSHDLFEGLFARAALASDIEVFDDQPAAYTVDAKRQHRWIRGDYQLLPWLLGLMSNRARLPWFSRWKIVDNLRRAMLGPTLILALLAAVLLAPQAALLVVGWMLAVMLSSVFVRLFANLVRKQDERSLSRWPLLWGDLKTNSQRAALNLTFVLDSSLLSIDAVARTLYRLTISRKNLLQWTATGQTALLSRASGLRIDVRLWAGALLAVLLAGCTVLLAPAALPFVLPLCALWAAAPVLATWLSQELPGRFDTAVLSDRDRTYARRIARKTWRFFETFVSAEDNWLPPDNYQEDPRGVVAHRTSPTNIGLYLLSCLAARDLGYLTLRELFARISATLDTFERLETYRGHLLNWYDTTTLRPLPLKYVSMVDSGNLLGHLWTLRQGCFELAQTRLDLSACLSGIEDDLLLAREGGASVDVLLSHLAQARSSSRDDAGITSSVRILRALAVSLPVVTEQARLENDGSYWLSEARTAAASWLEELENLAPFVTLLDQLPVSLVEDAEVTAWVRLLNGATSLAGLVDACEQVLPGLSARAMLQASDDYEASYFSDLMRMVELSHGTIQPLCSRMLREAARAGSLADRMDFAFMYDEDRSLFSIGYNVELGRLDDSRYDLLASEARLGSFAAIAKGDVPEEHWFHLSRARVRSRSRAVLVAWSGSMFEYLMPLLVMKRRENTLLDETYDSVVLAQRAYAEAQGVPWGISESAYNVMDLHMTYQYRAFGVQALGLKAGLFEDLVIAPYATVLSVMVDPEVALSNLRRLAKEGLEGPCGFYESVDYTPERVPPGRRCVVVKAYMAHHQGMALVALANVLNDSPMQRRFHADARVKATELLLEERAPIGVPATEERVIRSPAPTLSDEELSHVERVSLTDEPAQHCHVLGHGELATVVGTRGLGFTTWRGLDVHRYRENAETGSSGVFLYVRNRRDGKFWSAGFEPTRKAPDEYFVEFSPDKVRVQRRDGDIETIVEIAVSPEYPAEVRRISLLNHSKDTVELDLTSYMEVVLTERGADLAHRAFSNMFVDTEALPELGGVIATRRPRKRASFQPWCLQMLTPEGDSSESTFECETSRGSFLGRGHGYDAPLAMTQTTALSGSVGCVLDPVIALRRTVVLKPGERKRLALTTALSDSRAGLLSMADALSSTSGVTRAFELAWADARVELKHLGISGLVSHRFQRLLSAVLVPEPSLRYHGERPESGLQGTRTLWSLGISGDLPIMLVRLDDLELTDLVRDVLLAHEFYRLNNLQVDLLLWDEEPAGYLTPVHDKAMQVVRATASQGRIDQRGGVFLRNASRLSPDEQALVLSAAKVVLSVSKGSLARQLRLATKPREELSAPKAAFPTQFNHPALAALPDLTFANGIGGFQDDGREYVMRVAPGERPPLPWCNVIAQPSFGTLVTESGGGFTWACNSQRHRLTPWANDPVIDPVGEALYLKDDADGSIWSATPSPAPNGATYTVRHGQGYSRFERHGADFESDLTIFVAPDDPAKIYRLRVRNRSSQARTVSAYMFVDWAMGATRDQSRDTVHTLFVPEANTMIAENAFSAFPARCAYLTASRHVVSFTGDRSQLVGLTGSRARPVGIEQSQLSREVGAGLNPCGALHVILQIPAGGEETCAFVLGDAASRAEAESSCLRFAQEVDWNGLFERACGMWDDVLGHVVIKTPDPALDIMVNRWLLYQTLSCRIWGRSGFYQSGGAYGYRDQLQDVLALLHARPDVAREHLLKAAARQYKEGDVQHWWHPETGEGVRTRCSDDMLWLPFATAHYVRVTGDVSVLEEEVAFLDERLLAPQEHDLYSVPRVSEEKASLYEHCRRALVVATTQGEHGLPRMGGGDWNDGMDQVGAEGKGESVWLGWFLARVWNDFAVLARARGDVESAERARVETLRLGEALDAHAWDGAWYRRAYFDDGSLLGSTQSEECQIDAIAQSWSVLSGVANPQRARQALLSSLERLVKPEPGMMLLLTPAFVGKSAADPGYIRAYPAGVRENGGQYTHGVLWTVQALLVQGECDRAHALLSMLNPIHHGDSRADVERYKVEPYVVAADVYGAEQHYGRGGWTWYTGAAGWMYRIAVEDMLGLDVRGEHLCLRPRVPSSWREFSIDYRRGDTRFSIRYENTQGVDLNQAELVVLLDGQSVPATRIPLAKDGKAHRVQVTVRAIAAEQALAASAPPGGQ